MKTIISSKRSAPYSSWRDIHDGIAVRSRHFLPAMLRGQRPLPGPTTRDDIIFTAADAVGIRGHPHGDDEAPTISSKHAERLQLISEIKRDRHGRCRIVISYSVRHLGDEGVMMTEAAYWRGNCRATMRSGNLGDGWPSTASSIAGKVSVSACSTLPCSHYKEIYREGCADIVKKYFHIHLKKVIKRLSRRRRCRARRC